MKIWNADTMSEEEAEEQPFAAMGGLTPALKRAAESFVEKNFGRWDFPPESEVHIRFGGELYEFRVEARSEPVFIARVKIFRAISMSKSRTSPP